MKNNPGYQLMIALAFFVLFLNAENTSGQTPKGAFYTDAPVRNYTVQNISARIAAMYGADPEIVETYVQAAVNLERHTGIPATIIVAIAIHESSFKSVLFTNSGNPFGIKASAPWDGSTFSMWHDDEETKFRAYDSAEAAVSDFGKFIRSRTWYADALVCPMDDYACFLDGLKKRDSEPGFSMNPSWSNAVMSIIEKLGLQTFATQ